MKRPYNMGRPQLFVCFTAEGSTDNLFLPEIIKKTVEKLLYEEAVKDIDLEDIGILKTSKTDKSFKEYVQEAAVDAIKNGFQLMIVHTDSDKDTYEERIEHKFNPVLLAINSSEDSNLKEYGEYIVPIIPIKMIEAWLLADKELLKDEIGTHLSDAELHIEGNPESMADPKQRIIDAIRIAEKASTHRRKILINDIEELYEIIGAKLNISNLEVLYSYRKFVENLRKGLQKLGYIQPCD